MFSIPAAERSTAERVSSSNLSEYASDAVYASSVLACWRRLPCGFGYTVPYDEIGVPYWSVSTPWAFGDDAAAAFGDWRY